MPASRPWYFPLAKSLLYFSPPYPSTSLALIAWPASSLPAPRLPSGDPSAALATAFYSPRARRAQAERLTQPRIPRRTTHAARRPSARAKDASAPTSAAAPATLPPQLLKSFAQFPFVKVSQSKFLLAFCLPSPPDMKSARVSPRVTRVKASNIKGTTQELSPLPSLPCSSAGAVSLESAAASVVKAPTALET